MGYEAILFYGFEQQVKSKDFNGHREYHMVPIDGFYEPSYRDAKLSDIHQANIIDIPDTMRFIPRPVITRLGTGGTTELLFDFLYKFEVPCGPDRWVTIQRFVAYDNSTEDRQLCFYIKIKNCYTAERGDVFNLKLRATIRV